ncbi:MAG: hypothetical protein U9O55_02870 [Patescibacteria group bacterium]|nr:hypothetical protein [Patescibacteria group bacterium]
MITKLETPENYKCSHCKSTGCKLWGDMGMFMFPSTFLCADCLRKKNQGKNIKKEDNIIGWFAPAIPYEDGYGYWDFNEVPEDDYRWWKKLPL